MGNDLKTLHSVLDSDDPNMATARSADADIAKKSKAASGWFRAGTGLEAGNTGAKPDIWQNPQDFAAKLGDYQAPAKQLQTAANGDDVNAIKARLGPLGKACKACHDKYRSKMHH